MKGRFIAFEGIDGSGKSTQAKLLLDSFKRDGTDAYITSEPTDGSIGRLIRDALSTDPGSGVSFDSTTLALLFAADREWHVSNEESGILKAIGEGKVAICDRYYLSSIAYQSEGVFMDWVAGINSKATEKLLPDITFFIDVSVDVVLERIRSRNRAREVFEEEGRLLSVRGNYLYAIEHFAKEPVEVIDGNRPPEEVHKEIRSIIEIIK